MTRPTGPTRELEALGRRISACRRCPRLVEWRERVAVEKRAAYRDDVYWARPVPAFGDPAATVLIVGLAPAAHGANRTGRMFTGDSSGDWLYEALHRSGFASQPESISRDDGMQLNDCYIAAAVRCAPPANKPAPDEYEACRPYLEAEIRALSRVRVVITLGRIAHDAYLKAAGWWPRMKPRERPAFGHGAITALPEGVTLVSSYHPSRQNTNTGTLTRKMWHGVFDKAKRALES
jgi:uracil-DNA glycosylase family 4